jgi:hypothetical protein
MKGWLLNFLISKTELLADEIFCETFMMSKELRQEGTRKAGERL